MCLCIINAFFLKLLRANLVACNLIKKSLSALAKFIDMAINAISFLVTVEANTIHPDLSPHGLLANYTSRSMRREESREKCQDCLQLR